MESRQKQVFIVLGSPRSGTSALSRIFYKLGVDFGNHSNFLDTNIHKHNPIFFELQWVNEFNNNLMKSFDNYIWGKDHFLLQKEYFDNLIPFQEKLMELIQNEWSDCQIIGIKDPRICMVFPIWEKCLQDLGYKIQPILVFRHPLSVYNSNQQISCKKNKYYLNFWLQHNLMALHFTKKYQLCLVDYDELVESPISEIKKISSQFNFNIHLIDKAASIVDKHLLHFNYNKTQMTDVLVVNELYNSLIKQRECRDQEVENSSKLHENYQSIASIFVEELQQTQSELELSQSRLQQTQFDLERSESQLQQTQEELENSQSQLQRTQSELEKSWNNILAMESSKFWKLRQLWFKIKNRI